jgi:hypothetical protein
MDIGLKRKLEVKKRGRRRLQIWKLRSWEVKNKFDEEVDKIVIEGEGMKQRWTSLQKGLKRATEKVCGRSKGGGLKKKQAWWWTVEIGDAIKERNRVRKVWRGSGSEGDKELYDDASKVVKTLIAKAIKRGTDEMTQELERGGNEKVFRMAKLKAREKQEVIGAPCILNEQGTLITEVKERVEVWKSYCEKLMNVENEWDGDVQAECVEGPYEKVTEKEVIDAIRKMKKGKAAGPSEVCCEMLTNDVCVKELCEVANKLLSGESMPEEWKHSTVVTLFKGKGSPVECGNYRTIKLLEHGMKIIERVFESRLRQVVNLREDQYGFVKGKGTTDAIFILRQIQEKFLEKNKELFLVFVDLEKAFDRVPRSLIEWAMRRKGVPEYYVKVVNSMYDGVCSSVVVDGEESDAFQVRVGVHQGSVLSPLLFAIVIDVVTEEVSKVGRSQLFADDLVLVCETREEAVERFGAWREALESKGLKVNVAKSKLLRCSKNSAPKDAATDPCGVCGRRVGVNSVKCQTCSRWIHKKCTGVTGSLNSIAGSFECKRCKGEIVFDVIDVGFDGVMSVSEFCYLGDVLNDGGGCERAAIARVKAAWNKFRSLSGVLCTKGLSLKQKGLVYRVCVRSVLVYGVENWAMKKEVLHKLRNTERRMLRMMCGVTLKDRMRSEVVAEMVCVGDLEEHIRVRRLQWYGHVMRKSEEEEVRKIMSLVVDGGRGRGRPAKRWLDVLKEDMRVKGLSIEMAQDRSSWRRAIHGVGGTC